MLKSLTLHNLALFKKQEIEFNEKMNVILGETGAGKSLIFDAINFVLSFKTDKSLLRTGEELMRVDAVFEPIGENVKNLLREMDIDEEEELVVSRSLHSDGRTSLRVNGTPCSQTFVKQLASELVDTFLQHESLQILKAKNHIGMLDKFCDVASLKTQLKSLIEKKNELLKKLNDLGGDESSRAIKKDFLEFQIKELENANLKIGEDDELDERIKLLQNSEDIAEGLGEVLNSLEGDSHSVLAKLDSASRTVAKLGDIKFLPDITNRLEATSIELDDICSELKNILAEIDSDPLELDRLDQRRDKLRALKRKYGGTIESCQESLKKFKNELDEIIDSKEISEKINKEIDEIEKQQLEICEKLHNLRVEASSVVKAKLLEELKDLGMKSTQFEVLFKRKDIGTDGYDDVSFVFSANKGQELKDLAKTASGGESSRLMLAIKNIFANSGEHKTLLFDEIDSGISGEVGNMMAQKLASIAKRDQVITITHLPQVACVGNNFIKVVKSTKDNTTISEAERLQGQDIIDEIAHIIGGKDVTEVMLQNATELFKRGQQFAH